jgi:hypothetical protein
MKVFLLGGVVLQDTDKKYNTHLTLVRKVGGVIGRALILHRHDLLVCSPHKGSVDREAVLGAAALLSKTGKALIEFHVPELKGTQEELRRLTRSLPAKGTKIFRYPVSADESGNPNLTYTWLLSQLSAMSRAQVVLSFGGKVDGSASVLLPIAESQRKTVLPLPFLGGAAAQSFERQRNELSARLGDALSLLQDKAFLTGALALIDSLPNVQLPGPNDSEPPRIFLSYPTTRKRDADYVENFLRHQGCKVYRDLVTFEAGRSIQGEIREHIHLADIFLAIWCSDYACSPWCYDEIDIALTRHRDGRMIPWILCFDDTPIIPPGARMLPYYRITNRRQLEATLLKLLKQGRSQMSQLKEKK